MTAVSYLTVVVVVLVLDVAKGVQASLVFGSFQLAITRQLSHLDDSSE